MRRSFPALRAFAGLLCVSSLSVLAQEASPDWTVDNFRWSGVLAPEAVIEVLNPYGDVRLRAADAGEVEVSAMISGGRAIP